MLRREQQSRPFNKRGHGFHMHRERGQWAHIYRRGIQALIDKTIYSAGHCCKCNELHGKSSGSIVVCNGGLWETEAIRRRVKHMTSLKVVLPQAFKRIPDIV